MSKCLITTCSAEKSAKPGTLPAMERYQHPRINWVFHESQRLGLPMLILSGKFGLLNPSEPIPGYDHALEMGEVSSLVPQMVGVLKSTEAEGVRFYALPPDAAGWAPYHAAIRQACQAAGIPMQWISWKG